MKRYLSILFFLSAFLINKGNAQTITITSVSSSVICAGSPVTIDYTLTGVFNPANIFTAELSDITGAFPGVPIGTLGSMTSGSIAATIPAGALGGSAYKIRITSDDPVAISNESGPITIHAAPTPSIAGGTQIICNGTQATLAANTPTVGVGVWTIVAGPSLLTSQFSNTSDPGATFTPAGGAGNYALIWTITNAVCPPSSSLVVIMVDALPVISTGTSLAICAGSSTALVATGGVSYSWAPATGLSAVSGSTVTATPTATTTYTLTGTGANGCVNTATKTVSVNALPIVSAGADVTICNGSSTVLTGSGAFIYIWSPYAGLSSLIGTSVTANPVTTTTYSVSGTDLNGCIGRATVNVFVNALPPVSGGAAVSVCQGASTGLTASGALVYSWVPASGLSATTGNSVTATPMSTTIYTVTGTDGNGCTSRSSVAVVVNPLPYVSGVATSAICAGASTGVSAFGAVNYTWTPGTGLSATTGHVLVANPATTTTYTVTGTNGYGCSASAPVTVTVHPIPVVSAGSNVAICNGSSTILTGSGGGTYSWSPGTGLSITTGSTVIAHPATTTTYTLTVINVCINRATVTVTVNPLPAVTCPGAIMCAGTPVGLTASGAVSYTWSPATGLSSTVGSSVVANPTSTTTYSVTGTSAVGCAGVATATVLVHVLPSVSVSPGVDICNGASTILTGIGATIYSWAPGSGLSSTAGSSVIAAPTTTTTYTLTGTNIHGCSSRVTARIGVNALPSIFTVTGGGSFCSGGTGVPVGLAGSQGGINYELLRGGLITGISRLGTGSALDFGHPGLSGFYTVAAINPVTGCSDTMSGGAGVTIVLPPAIVGVTGGGAYCDGGTGVRVGLTGSVIGVDYQLYRGGVAIGSPLPGIGYGLDFGFQTITGTYTVVASTTPPSVTCTSNMSGSAVVSQYAQPALFAVSGGGAYCEDGPGVHIGLVGSQIGVRYGVYLSGTPVSVSVIGLAAPLDFGLFTTPGTYYVIGTTYAGACADSMTGSATISINPLPAISGSNTVSPSGTTTLTATPAGGTWSSQLPAIATVSAAGVVAGVSLGNTVITYTLPTGCFTTYNMGVRYNVGVSAIDNAAQGISLAPNPNNGVFMLNSTFADLTMEEATIEITDVPGRVVYRSKVAVRDGIINARIELTDMAAGMYLLTLRTAAENKVVRFVKEL